MLTILLLPAMTSLFDEADTSNDGKISIDEYLQLTKNYGIEVHFFNIIVSIVIVIRISITIELSLSDQ